jgi:hypothetical protein
MRKRTSKGSALVEFALISLVLYLILAGTIELGRMVFAVQILQDAARVAARELAVTPLAAGLRFEEALATAEVQTRIWNPSLLVVNASTDTAIESGFQAMPLVNRALRPLFISDTLPQGDGGALPILRYPGALVPDPAAPLQWTVKVPRPGAAGAVVMMEIVAEARMDAADPASGPFSALAPVTPNGIAAVVVNYPFQAAALSGFAPRPEGEPNAGYAIEAPENEPIGTYAGADGLGAQYAMGKKVRPYRRILTGQAFFRREVME